VRDEKGVTIGILTDKNLLMRLYKNEVQLDGPIKRAISKDLRQVSKALTLNELSRVLTRNSVVLVEDKYFIAISDVLDLIAADINPKAVI
jgi:predicted transcriptional regulator